MIWILVGTRPEVIKQTPLYLECVKLYGRDKVKLIGTGQHRELLDQALAHFAQFGVKLDHNLEIMKENQTLCGASAAVMVGMEKLFLENRPELGRPDWLVVQGDTTSAAMAGIAAFQNGIKVAHNEAGLRSYDMQHPYPEEANRRLAAVVADLHLAPTGRAAEALLKEGIDRKRIHITGNTGIDALRMTLEMPVPKLVEDLLERCRARALRPVLLTAHRRENRGDAMRQWFQTLAQFLKDHPDLALVYPVHPNNAARAAAEEFLAPLKQVFMFPAINYGETCHLLSRARFAVTDSGGIQEEASSLGVPVVVCRKTTERMEAVDAGLSRLAGTQTDTILAAMEWAYQESSVSVEERSLVNHVFGDGFSSARIAPLLK